jgi:UDP-glucose 4-epimerase
MRKVFEGKNAMVTGGLGFIGSNLAIHLAGLGASVLVVDSLIPEYGGNAFNIEPVKDRVKVNFADIRTQTTMNLLVRDQECIFNLAGQVSHLDSMADPFTDLEINCRAQLTLLEALRKNNDKAKIVFAATRQQYGKPDYLPLDEKHLMHPTDVNGINKMAGEWYHILYNNVYGIKASSLRLTNTFGPRQMMKNDRQTFLAWFLRLALENKPIRIFGNGEQLRDFNFVEDVVEAFLLAMASDKANGEVFNLGGRERLSIFQVAERIVGLCGSGSIEKVSFPEEKKKIEIGSVYSDYSKIRERLGWQPKIGFEEGLKATIEYYRKFKNNYW